jgi:hypothetical protein
MYWIATQDAPSILTRSNARSVRGIVNFLGVVDPLTPAVLDDLVTIIGDPKPTPKVLNMAQAVAAHTGTPVATELYFNLYAPLSNLFMHPSGLALMRHVLPDDTLRERPDRFWSRRAALHAIDACVAQLATAVAAETGQSTVPFADYAHAHMSRTPHPVMTMTARRSLRHVRPWRIPKALRALRALQRAQTDGEHSAETTEAKIAFIEAGVNAIIDVFDFGADTTTRDEVISKLARALVADEDARSPS